MFLFSTQKELYNAILGVTTAAAVSVPTLIRTVSMLAGRRSSEGDSQKSYRGAMRGAGWGALFRLNSVPVVVT